MCQNYEKQLQRIQSDFNSIKHKEEVAIDSLNVATDNLASETGKIANLEKETTQNAESMKKQVQESSSSQKSLADRLEEVAHNYEEYQQDIMLELEQLSEARDHSVAQCESLRQENEALGQSSKSVSTDVEIDRVLNTYEDLKDEASASEQMLKGEIMFLKDRAFAEKFDRETTENVLQQELEEAKQEADELRRELDKLKEVPAMTSTASGEHTHVQEPT